MQAKYFNYEKYYYPIICWLDLYWFCTIGAFKLTNALIVAQLDKEDDRFSLEINLAEFLADRGVRAVPS